MLARALTPILWTYLVLHSPSLSLGSQVPTVNLALVRNIDQHGLRLGVEMIDLHNPSFTLVDGFNC